VALQSAQEIGVEAVVRGDRLGAEVKWLGATLAVSAKQHGGVIQLTRHGSGLLVQAGGVP